VKRRSPITLLAAVACLLSTLSILAGLRHALGRHERAAKTEIERARETLGEDLAVIDLNDYPEHMRPRRGLPDAQALRRRMKRAERPAWIDLREEPRLPLLAKWH
jgi:hypothetical protein